MLRLNKLKIMIAAVVIVSIIILVVLSNPRLMANVRATFISPGGGYKVVLYTYPFPSFAMPGQGSDREGFARVYNTASGALLCEIDIPLVGQVNERDVRWFPKSVALPGKKGFEDCQLQ